jgi:hypothetical protein
MFFRREKPHEFTFEERLKRLKEFGFTVTQEGNRARVSKLGCAAMLEGSGAELTKVGKSGVIVGNEIGYLVHGGYQAFLESESGRKVPALAEHLKALHDFQEDLREGLGLTSLYNMSLGTTFNKHIYDRVEDRDVDRPDLPWEAPLRDDR